MLFPGRIFIARGPLHVLDFCYIFLPNICEDQEKSYYLSEGPWTVPHGKYGASYCITFMKSLDETWGSSF